MAAIGSERQRSCAIQEFYPRGDAEYRRVRLLCVLRVSACHSFFCCMS